MIQAVRGAAVEAAQEVAAVAAEVLAGVGARGRILVHGICYLGWCFEFFS